MVSWQLNVFELCPPPHVILIFFNGIAESFSHSDHSMIYQVQTEFEDEFKEIEIQTYRQVEFL